ncbi:MAG: hypothetical protein KF746_09860 [Chitinophagaceae bacterium]|nr:hypothetical protein [Chitinophagaceae bacterium]
MIKQFRTRSQQVTMLIALLALVIAIATSIQTDTTTAKQDEVSIRQDKETDSEGRSLASELKDFPWSPVISFFIVR